MRTTSILAISILAGAAFAATPVASPVADAVMKGDKAALKTLLAQKADVNAVQADGATAIQWAVYRNDGAMADQLIAAGASVKQANREGFTPLVLASIDGNAAMIAKLLKAGAGANDTDANGDTPLMFASRNGNPDAVKALLDGGANVNAKEKVRGTTALMWATEQGHPAAMKLLIGAGADVKAVTNPDAKGGTAYLAPTVANRLNSSFGVNGGGGQGGGGQAGGGQGGAQAGGRGGNQGNAAAAGGRGGNAGQGQAGAQANAGGNGGGRGGNGRGGAAANAGAAGAAAGAAEEDFVAAADAAAANQAFNRGQNTNGGGLTSLLYAARQDCMECAKVLLDAGADVNQTSRYGWSPLLTATQNRHYKLGAYLLERGANPNIQNNGGWSPIYLATDNRNIEGGDYPVRAADMDHLAFIKLLIDKGANVNIRVCGKDSTPTQCNGDSTETRTIFTMQWLYEDGATPFWRAAQSADLDLMKLLLAHGADPKLGTSGTRGGNVSPLAVAAGIGWVEGITYEWGEKENLETIKMLLDLGLDPNQRDTDGRTALHGAAHKGRNEVVKMLVARGAKLDQRDLGSRDTVNGAMLGITWMPLHYAQGLVRVGVQSAIAHPETADLIKQLMRDKGLKIPADISSSICLTTVCGADN